MSANVVKDTTKVKTTKKKSGFDVGIEKVKDFIEDNPELVNKAKDVLVDIIEDKLVEKTTKKKSTSKRKTTKKKTSSNKGIGIDDVADIANILFK